MRSAPINNSPLSWPAGWKRTKNPKRSNFGGGWGKDHSIGKATRFVMEELDRLGASHRNRVISTNLRYRLDGLPYSNQRDPDDKGVAVYFTLGNQELVLACDRWDRIADNLWAIGKHIDATRGCDRWGVGNVEQAFAGYVQISDGRDPWWQVLGIAQNATADEIKEAHRLLLLTEHPDLGGSEDRMKRINVARDEGLRAIGGT